MKDAGTLYEGAGRAVVSTCAAFGARAKARPVNDVEIDGRRAHGLAQIDWYGAFVHSRTFLVHTDIDGMAQALRPSMLKFADKGSSSVRDRVVNLAEAVVLEPNALACPSAAAAFGFRPLRAGHAAGKGLLAAGIVADAAIGKAIYEGMACLPSGCVERLALRPLAVATALPDVVIVEGPPEALMWLALAELVLAGGQRRRGDTTALHATCVQATVSPHLEQRPNPSLGCSGCRDATDIDLSDAIVGFPGAALPGLVENLERFGERAMPRSRDKTALAHLRAAAKPSSAG